MTFNILLGLSIVVCLAGLGLRLYFWFAHAVHPPSTPPSFGQRFSAAISTLFKTIFSTRLSTLIQSFFLDVLLQQRILQKSNLRWLAHSLIFFGFILLFFFHALDDLVTVKLFSDYQSTLNPWLFLRNLLGMMVLAGVALAVYRRFSLKAQRLKSSVSDWAALAFLAAIICSGIILEGARISSPTMFDAMVEEYGAFDEQELADLKAYWVVENGLRSSVLASAPTADQVAAGQEVHANSCLDCHAGNGSAFVSSTLRGLSTPLAAMLGDQTAISFLWYLHVIICLSFLAWLPFSKMFHILAAPVSLAVRRVVGIEPIDDQALTLNRQMVGLSACTHCGSCSLECSSSMFYEHFNNEFILPSEKIQYLKKFAAGKENDPAVFKRMQEGLYICTSCDRCTTVCPSGINLRDIFVSCRYRFLDQGVPEATMLSHFSFPLALARTFVDDHLKALTAVTRQFKEKLSYLSDVTSPILLGKDTGSMGNETFRSCYSCQRCTNICPVVRASDNPTEELGMLPHQIMFSLGIGREDLAVGAQMLWSCSTCYLCQEHCPNQVELTDIFYGLKNKAVQKLEMGVN